MRLPSQPITLSPEQIREMNRQLSEMRHDIKNHLAVIGAAIELSRDDRARGTFSERWPKIRDLLDGFSTGFERDLGINRS